MTIIVRELDQKIDAAAECIAEGSRPLWRAILEEYCEAQMDAGISEVTIVNAFDWLMSIQNPAMRIQSAWLFGMDRELAAHIKRGASWQNR